jgi:CRISPR-associated endonuclease/helicase Cas3
MNSNDNDQYSDLLSEYAVFFRKILGGKVASPFDYQVRLAESLDKVSLLNVPTGAGKTKAIIGAWLWQRLTKPENSGRRLIYCLPMRTLVEQTADVAFEVISSLKSEAPFLFENDPDRFRPYTLMGGKVEDDWEHHPEREAILIGTQDMLLSRALNRGYGMSRFKWPIHFGLLNNDCLWVYDEVQLMSDGLATSAQMDAYRRRFGTFGKCHSIWMSATLDRGWLNHFDFSPYVENLSQLELSSVDDASEVLNKRLTAHKDLSPAPPQCRHPKGLASFVKSAHQPGTQTLIVVNTVQRAREVYDQISLVYGVTDQPIQLKKGTKQNKDLKNTSSEISDPDIPVPVIPEIDLIHSRFRVAERERWKVLFNNQVDDRGPGRIIIATQVIEAGVDISSRLLVTDIAPFSSLVQRFGRCNRNGEHDLATIFWVDRPLTEKTSKLDEKTSLEEEDWAKIAAPYDAVQLTETISIIANLESASLKRLSTVIHRSEYQPEHLLRSRDLIDLFDTTPDLSGYDVDISRFVRGGDDNDVSVAWRTLNKEKPNSSITTPDRREICSVPVYELKDFLKVSGRYAWVWDALEGNWRDGNREPIVPGMTVLLDADCGGYDRQRGWDSKSSNVVEVLEVSSSKNESYDDDPLSWVKYNQTLSAHSFEARQAAARILGKIEISDLDEFHHAILEATQHHDWGKAHPIFQATLHGLSGEAPPNQALFSPHLAKSKSGQRHSRRRFRHELASALALLQTGAEDLVIYLAACHHGKVRLSIRALPDETRPDSQDLRFARGIWDLDTIPETDLGGELIKSGLVLNLEPMMMGSIDDSAPSWLERMIRLRNRVGVFRLAYLESLIRAADVQSSRNPLSILEEQVN